MSRSSRVQPATLSFVDVDLQASVHNQRDIASTPAPPQLNCSVSLETSHSNLGPCTPAAVGTMASRFLVSCYPCPIGISNASAYTRVSGLLLLMATMLDIVAIATPYWEYVVNDIGDSHSGLWWVCIMGMCDQLINHPLLGWFRVVQALMMLSSFGLVASVVTAALYMFAIALDTYRRKFLFGAFISSLISGVALLIAVVVYGVYQGEPDPSTLSWSYYLALLSALLTLLASTCLALEIHRLLTLPARSDENFILQNRSTAPTEGYTNSGRDRSESTLSVSSLMDNSEKRPLKMGEVRMRSYSSSLMTPIPESPSAASTGSAPGDLPGRKFTFSEVKPVTA